MPDPHDASSTRPPEPARSGMMRRLSALFLILRRFLNATLLARSNLLIVELRALAGRTEALHGRIDGLDQRLDALAQRADSIQERLDDTPRRFDGLQERVDDLPRRFDALQARVDEGPGRFDRLHALAEQVEAETRRLWAGFDAFAQRQDDHATAQSYVARNATETARRTVSALGRAEAALATQSARFDELDIKSRPLIAYDDESWAVRLREGYALVPRADPVFATAVANASSGGLEPGTRLVLHALIEPGMGVADVGANVGLLTLACAFATGPGGRVWSFEPEAGPRAQLAKTLHLNGLAWVALSAAAVGAKVGRATFNVSPLIGHSSLHPLPADEQAHARKLEVEVTTLDATVPAGQRLDVVKIDVEGAELDVLAGMTRLLEENADLAVIAEFGPSHLERLGVSREAWFGAFAAHGFTPYLIEEPFGACRAVGEDLAALDGVYSANIAFVRPGGAAQARLPQA